MKIKVEALKTYEEFNVYDNELKKIPKKGEIFFVSKKRLNILLGNNKNKRIYVKVVEEKKEEKKSKKRTKKTIEK